MSFSVSIGEKDIFFILLNTLVFTRMSFSLQLNHDNTSSVCIDLDEISSNVGTWLKTNLLGFCRHD